MMAIFKIVDLLSSSSDQVDLLDNGPQYDDYMHREDILQRHYVSNPRLHYNARFDTQNVFEAMFDSVKDVLQWTQVAIANMMFFNL